MFPVKTIKKYRLAFIIGGVGVLFGGLWYAGAPSKAAPKKIVSKPSKITHAEEVVDPRDTWTHRIEEKHEETLQKYDEVHALQKGLLDQIDSLRQEVRSLKDKNALQEAIRVLPQESEASFKEEAFVPEPLAHLSLRGEDESEDLERPTRHVATYVPAGTYVQSVLLTGVAAPTTTNSSENPVPILLRFLKEGSLPKGFKAPLKEARLIGACHGNISSERAECRIHTLTYVEENGEIIEKKVEGWIIGEDGRAGMRGKVIDRSNEHVRAAFINGLLGGISNFFSQQATHGIYPISPITGQTNAMRGEDLAKGSLSQGTGSALNKLADYAIKKAEQMQPIIMVESGRVVDVLFKTGIDFQETTTVKRAVHTEASAQTHIHAETYAADQLKEWQQRLKDSLKSKQQEVVL